MQRSISLWKVAGALVKPNAILLHSKKPNGPTEKAVLCLSAFFDANLPITRPEVQLRKVFGPSQSIYCLFDPR